MHGIIDGPSRILVPVLLPPQDDDRSHQTATVAALSTLEVHSLAVDAIVHLC